MRTAISAGALVLALGGALPVAAATSASAAARIDCGNGGLIGGLTGELCKAVTTVGDVVNQITGNTSATAADTHDSGGAPKTTADDPGARSAAAPSAEPSGEPAPEGAKDSGLLPTVLNDVCLSLVASPECPSPSATSTPEQAAEPSPSPHPSPSRRNRHKPAERKTVPIAAEPVRPPETRTHTTDTDEPVIPQPPPAVDAEAPRVELLWPGPAVQEFQKRMPGRQAVTPTRSSDTLGTAFTAALLVVAILAVRVLYAKRTGEESMPFEPLRVGRHRMA
ncbi:hypothetical protein [Streptosporangium sp. NPDC000396]|uniref:hypothetical protein n=1 Tax=Streptosporangium sp. NPDC000396 TaxID=3366185 RepID=UPI00367C786A